MSQYRTDLPCYRILDVNGFYGDDDHLYPMDSVIYFEGEPNEEMEPVNELARLKLVAYLDKLDARGHEVAEKLGKTFVARPRNLDGAIELATSIARQTMPIMGAKEKRSSIQSAEEPSIPETGSLSNSPEKRGRGRPAGSKNKPSMAA